MQNTAEILLPETTYHVYNRANGNEKLFLSPENYRYFLGKYQDHISPIAETFCYCLMPNHFHFLIRIKEEKELNEFFSKAENKSATHQGFKTLDGLRKQDALSKLLTQKFSHLFNGYTQAFNKQYNRMGSLLMHPYKRKKITDQIYLLNLVRYIHYNPVESRLSTNLENWQYSSYSSIISNKPSFLKTNELIEWFDDKTNFIHFHRRQQNFNIDDID